MLADCLDDAIDALGEYFLSGREGGEGVEEREDGSDHLKGYCYLIF